MIQKFKPLVLALWVPVFYTIFLMGCSAVISGIPFPYSRYVYGVFGILGAAAAIWIVLKWDKDPPVLRFRFDTIALTNFAKGLLIAIMIGGAMIGSQIWFSDLTLTFQRQHVTDFALMAFTIVVLSYMEELVFRSYAFFRLEKSYGIWTAQIVIAVLFALSHVIGGWSLSGSFIGPGIWAFAFGLLASKSGGIALPTGFHSGLNFALAAIGDKHWIPGLFKVDFSETPTEAMIQSNSNFGLMLHVVLLVVLILSTWMYSRKQAKK